MTNFFAPEDINNIGPLGDLANEAVQACLVLGARIEAAMQHGQDLPTALASAGDAIDAALSAEMIELALANAGGASPIERGNKLGFQLLTTRPNSPISRLLGEVARRACRRAGPALGPLLEPGDLVSLLRWKLWTLPAGYFGPMRILKHPGLAAYLSVIARRIVIDECRAMERHARTGIDAPSIEASVDPRATLESVLDELDLLQRFASELSSWQAPLVPILAGQLDRDEGLAALNHKRQDAGLLPWSADAMRTAIHRARRRLRVLMTSSVALQAPAFHTGTVPTYRHTDAPTHDWRRFWSQRDGSYSLGFSGFLVDPETEFGRHVHAAVALDRLVEMPCLILLGEPGIGKSTAIAQECQRLRDANEHASLIDLARPHRTETLRALVRRMQSRDDKPFHLFFDGFDEGLTQNPNLVSELGQLIHDLVDSPRARVRIASRTLEWPVALEAQLKHRWSDLRVYELLPLRRIDVIAAANDHGIDGASFVTCVQERDATSLAIRPISLRFLLAMYETDGTLPRSKARLYDQGTLILCSEQGVLQRGGRRPNPDTYRRRAIAARLAALSTFTNRHIIARAHQGDGILAIEAIAGETEVLAGATYRADPAAVEDVLAGTALFTARTATTYGWSHQSYREFLAGWHLAQHQVDVNGATALYFPRRVSRIPSPLREVAAWHAAFAPAIFDLLAERDPEVLLRSDSGAASPMSRAQLTHALLDRMARFEALDGAYRHSDYHQLEHPGLAEQVRPYILDRDANPVVRRAAMEIAGACHLDDVVDALVAVLFNRSDHSGAREIAAGVLGKIGGEQVCGAFLALLASGFDPDPDDIIRGSILSFLWPANIEAGALFCHLTLPKRDNLVAAYQRFLHELPDTLGPHHLAIALNWVAQINHRADYALQDTLHDIIDAAVRSLDRTDVRTALCQVIHRSLQDHLGTWYAGGARRHGRERSLAAPARRLIAEEMLRISPDDEDLARDMLWFEPPLLHPEDIRWLSNHARDARNATFARACGRCVAALYEHSGYPVHAETADAVVSVESAEFLEPLRPFLAPVELGSELARQLAENWARGRRARQISAQEPDGQKPEPPPASSWVRSLPHLERAEAGELASWIDFVASWTESSYDAVNNVPEWATLEPANQNRILLAGLRYVNDFEAPDLSWLEQSGSYPTSTVAARSVLQLIGAFRPDLLGAISGTAWRRWCPTLIAVPFPDIEPAVRRELFRRCDRLSELGDAILQVVRRENRAGGHVLGFAMLPDPLPEALHPVVLELLPELGDLAFEDGLGLLLRSRNPAARELAQKELRDGPAERGARSARVILPQHGASWTPVISRMQRDRDFIAAFAPLVSFDEDMEDNPFTTLPEQGAAELWLTIIQQFPPEGLPPARGTMGPMDHIQRLHQRMASMLVNCGTVAGVAALEWLVAREPKREHLRYLLVQARAKLADDSWHPLSIDEFKDTMRGSVVEDLPPSHRHVRCMLSIQSGSNVRQIERILARAVQGASTAISSGELLVVDTPPEEVSVLLHAIENTPELHAVTRALRAGKEWIFEAIPSISPAASMRCDAGRAEVKQLLESVDVLIETATETETTAVHAAMTPLPGKDALLVGSVDRVATYTIGLFGGYPVAHVQTEMGPEGPNAAQLATLDAIGEVAPKLVLLIGIAFGMDRTTQRLGDVLVAKHVTGYEMVKLKPDTIEERGETLRADATMVERITAHRRTWRRTRADGSQIAVHVGQVVSGAKLVNSREFRDSLASRFPSALGGEMEGCGAYAAALRSRVPVILAKAICDWADGRKNDHAQQFAAAAAVDLIRHVLDKPDVLHPLGIRVKSSSRS